ncbi:MAG TPA: hypothetical protein VFY23_17335 [Candidatus Limnocylindrales bacterium]|nr:hypothetical protein [Candidatus Limnocylindrales bacterium]
MPDFSWWLLILGVVAGGLLTWLVLADSTRREREIGDEEMAAEATWIARTLDRPEVDAAVAEDVLRAHRRYLGFPPPDVLVAPEELVALGAQGVTAEPPSDLVADEPVEEPAGEPSADPVAAEPVDDASAVPLAEAPPAAGSREG